MGLMVAVVMAVMMAGPARSVAGVLERVELVGDPATAVRLRLSAPAVSRAEVLDAQGDVPDRIYIDLPRTTLRAGLPKVTTAGGPVLLRVRTGQFDAETTRVVLDLARAVPFRLHESKDTILVELQPQLSAHQSQPAGTPPEALAASPHAERPAAPARDVTPPAFVGPPLPPPDWSPPPERLAATPPLFAPETPAATAVAPSAPLPDPASAERAAASLTTAQPFVGPPLPPPGWSPPPERPAVAATPVAPDTSTPMMIAGGPGMCPGPPPAVACMAPLAATPLRRISALRAQAAQRAPGKSPYPLVVLDAGHGGRDPGAEGVGGVVEKDVVLEVAQLVARRLAARLPVDVLMTRTDDSFIPIEHRLASENATLFISLHANACADPSARGLEIFYGGGPLHASTGGTDWRAALLGRCLDQALQARVGGVRGNARPAGFGVLVRNPVPSALVEIGYLTHPGEAARTRDRNYHELLADALVDGVAAFLRASAPPL